MAFEVVQPIRESRWAFSTKKQADMTTLVLDANLNRSVETIGFDYAANPREVTTNQAMANKGHEYATSEHELMRSIAMRRTFQMSSLMAGWAAAFGMGSVSSVQPDAVNNPTAWQHTFLFSNPVTTKQVPVTSIYEEIYAQAAVRRKLHAMAVNGFTISGRVGEFAQLSIDLVGSGNLTEGTVALPALTALAFLPCISMNFHVAVQAGANDLAERLIDFSVSVPANIDLANARHPASGLYAGRLWHGPERIPTIQFRMFADQANTDLLTLKNDRTMREITLKLTGDLILAGEPEANDVQIKFPAAKLTEVTPEVVDGKAAWNVTVEPKDIYKDASGTPDEALQIIVTNTEPSYLTT